MIQIKDRIIGKVIKEVDATSLVNADLRDADLQRADLQNAALLGANLQGANLLGAKLQFADLRGADLQGADLRYATLQFAKLQRANLLGADLQFAKLQRANLLGADLCSADMRCAFGDGERIKTINDHYRIVIMLEYGVMAIGCEQHSIDEWMNFSNAEINIMDTYALQWWKAWKPRIQKLIAG